MSTTSLKASEVMDWVASLMNDTAKATYTYAVTLPYLNMAIDNLLDDLNLHNASPTDMTAEYITLAAGLTQITPVEDATLPHYPNNLLEIRQLSERLAGTSDSFVPMVKQDFLNVRTQMQSLIDWMWQDQRIKFIGALSARELKLDYIKVAIAECQNENSPIDMIGAKAYLAYKTAAICARYIGENPTRADSLENDAQGHMDDLLGVVVKGKQSIYTRRRPFRAAFKSRGWF